MPTGIAPSANVAPPSLSEADARGVVAALFGTVLAVPGKPDVNYRTVLNLWQHTSVERHFDAHCAEKQRRLGLEQASLEHRQVLPQACKNPESFHEDSLLRSYLRFIERHQFEATASWHDLMHFVAGFTPTAPGEVGVALFHCINEYGHKFLRLLPARYWLRSALLPREPEIEYRMEAFARGFMLGKLASPADGADWSHLLALPLPEARTSLRMPPEGAWGLELHALLGLEPSRLLGLDRSRHLTRFAEHCGAEEARRLYEYGSDGESCPWLAPVQRAFEAVVLEALPHGVIPLSTVVREIWPHAAVAPNALRAHRTPSAQGEFTNHCLRLVPEWSRVTGFSLTSLEDLLGLAAFCNARIPHPLFCLWLSTLWCAVLCTRIGSDEDCRAVAKGWSLGLRMPSFSFAKDPSEHLDEVAECSHRFDLRFQG